MSDECVSRLSELLRDERSKHSVRACTGNCVPRVQDVRVGFEEGRMRTILLVGEDSLLLQARAAVLVRLGASLLATATDLSKFPTSQDVDVVVLCGTVQPELQTNVVRNIHEKWKPRATILQIETIGAARRNGGAEFFADSKPERWANAREMKRELQSRFASNQAANAESLQRFPGKAENV